MRRAKKTSKHPTKSENAPHKRKIKATEQKPRNHHTANPRHAPKIAPILTRNAQPLTTTPPKHERRIQAKFSRPAPKTKKQGKAQRQTPKHPKRHARPRDAPPRTATTPRPKSFDRSVASPLCALMCEEAVGKICRKIKRLWKRP